MWKRIAGISAVGATAALVAVSVAAAQPTARQVSTASHAGSCPKGVKVGVVDLIAQSPIDNKTSKMAVQTAQALGWSVQFVDAAGDPAKGQAAIQSFVDQKYDLIINTSIDAAPIRTALQAAKKAGIPVFETAAGNKASDLFAGMYNEDETTMGRILMEYIVKTVPKAQISDLTTRLNYAGLLRDNAIKAVLAKASGAKIAAANEVDLTNPVVNTTKIVTDHLTAHPDINAVYAVFDNMAAAAINAVRAKGSKAGVYSYFSTAANLKYLRQKGGILKAVADANLPLGAVVAFDQFLAWKVKGKAIDKDALKKLGGMTYKIVDQSNVPPSGEVFSNTGTLKPFLAKWKKAYGC